MALKSCRWFALVGAVAAGLTLVAPGLPARAEGPKGEAAAWLDLGATIATDAGGAITVGEVLLGRTITGAEPDPNGVFATMLVKALRTRLVDLVLAADEGVCKAAEIEELSNLIAEYRDMPTKTVVAVLEEETLLLRQLLADRESGRTEWPVPDSDDRVAQRSAQLRVALPTVEAVRSRLQDIETSKPEVALFGADARTLCRRIRAAEALTGAPVTATQADIQRMRDEALREHSAAGRTTPIMLPRSADLRIRVDKADKIVRSELQRRLQDGEITLTRPEMLAPARAAADPANVIGWL